MKIYVKITAQRASLLAAFFAGFGFAVNSLGVGALCLALALGLDFLAQKIKLSPDQSSHQ